jgi:hypothetical protein
LAAAPKASAEISPEASRLSKHLQLCCRPQGVAGVCCHHDYRSATHLYFGYDFNQLLAWTLIGTAYNLEGHSSLSIFLLPSDFHDLHHTSFQGNHGIQGLWDKAFKTLNTPTYQRRLVFPVSFLHRNS